jgi:ketosteroid isomerase-like protein
MYGAYNRGDLDGVMDLFATDAHVENPVLGQEHTGPVQIRKLFEEYFEVVEDPQVEPLDAVESGEFAVFSVRLKGRLRHTGISNEMITTDMAHAFRVRDGRVVWHYICMTQPEALEAAGLSE